VNSSITRKISKYSLLGYLKTRGFSELLLARNEDSGTLNVIKRPTPSAYDDSEIINTFRRESEILKNLSHENICSFIESFEIDGKPFMVLEYLHGKNLSEIINELSSKKIAATRSTVAYVGLNVLKGLACAHKMNLLHRDISPTNIFVTMNGMIKILDFGIAIRKELRVTDPSIIKGKIRYMSPEQLRGEPLDARTDIFSLGICLYEFASASPLFMGQNLAEISKNILHGDIKNLKDLYPCIDNELDLIIMKALERDVAKRYANAHEMQVVLEHYLNDLQNAGDQTKSLMQNLFPVLLKSDAEYKKFHGDYMSAEQMGEETSDRIGAEEITLVKKEPF
jgi:serine/threonine-protein kinase